MRTRIHFVTIVLSCWLLVGCGGSDGEHSINTVELSASSKQAVAGDWPVTGYYAFYTVQDQMDWQALWSERLAKIDCSRPFNAAACSQTEPPSVDFSRFTLVGLYLDRYGEFNDLGNTLRVFSNNAGLVIEFSSTTQPTALVPTTMSPVSSFFLVPKPASGFPQITFHPNGGGA